MRRQERIQGRVTVTPLELRRGTSVYSLGTSGGSVTGTRIPQTFTYVPGDYTADGDFWYVDVPHGLHTVAFIMQAIDTQTGQTVLFEKDDRVSNLDVCRVWFSFEDPARYRTIIVY